MKKIAHEENHKENATALYHLGIIYRDGNGVEPDIEEATLWYYMAAEQGHAQAQYDLGMIYHDNKGDSLLRDDDEAFVFIKAAAEQGHGLGQFELGSFYLNGYGTEYDLKESYIWTVMASKNGVENATKLLREWERIMQKEEIKTLQKEADRRLKEIERNVAQDS